MHLHLASKSAERMTLRFLLTRSVSRADVWSRRTWHKRPACGGGRDAGKDAGATVPCMYTDVQANDSSTKKALLKGVSIRKEARRTGYSIVNEHKKRHRLMAAVAAILCLCLLVPVTCRADVLTVGTRKHRGTFEGFENRQFLFRTSDGRLLHQDRPTVRSMKLRWLPRKGRHHEGRPKPKRRIDISALEKRNDLTDQQTSVIRRYRAVRMKYDAFVAKSSAMVAEMDDARGKRREDLMDSLRRRKDAEQPLKRDLENATAALLAAFPDPLPDAGDPERGDGGQPAEQGKTRIPEIGEDEILLIDVAGLKGPSLSREQASAIKTYEAAKRRYQAADADAKAVAGLQDAQSILLKAFSGLKIVQ